MLCDSRNASASSLVNTPSVVLVEANDGVQNVWADEKVPRRTPQGPNGSAPAGVAARRAATTSVARHAMEGVCCYEAGVGVAGRSSGTTLAPAPVGFTAVPTTFTKSKKVGPLTHTCIATGPPCIVW